MLWLTRRSICMIQEFTYIIPGIPMNYYQFNNTNQREWGNQHETLLHHQFLLAQQHGDKKLHDGPLDVQTIFYFPIKKKQSHTHYLPFKYSFFNLIKSIQRFTEGIIITKNAYISTFDATIRRSHDPRTIILIRKDM